MRAVLVEGLLASSPRETLGFGRKELTKEGRILSIFNIVEYGSETRGLNAVGSAQWGGQLEGRRVLVSNRPLFEATAKYSDKAMVLFDPYRVLLSAGYVRNAVLNWASPSAILAVCP